MIERVEGGKGEGVGRGTVRWREHAIYNDRKMRLSDLIRRLSLSLSLSLCDTVSLSLPLPPSALALALVHSLSFTRN